MSNSVEVGTRVSGAPCEICGWTEWDVKEIVPDGERFAVCRNCSEQHPAEYADTEVEDDE